MVYTSTADWKDEAAKERPKNGTGNQDPYRIKQNDLGSQIFEQTDYTEHMPLSKASSEAILSKKLQKYKVRQFHGHKVNDEFKKWAPKQEVASENYDAKSRQKQNLQGNY